MKTVDLLKFKLIATAAILASLLLFTSCEEKKSEPLTKPIKNPPGSDESDGSDEGDEGDEGGEGDEGAGFNLCSDGLKKSTKLDSWSSLVEELCDDGKLKELRKSTNVYKGGDPIVSHESTGESEETNILLNSSSQYSSKVDDYWSLVRLQTTDPGKFRDLDFLYDENVDMKEVDASKTSSSYHYTNHDAEGGGHVEYKAKTSYITLKKGVAYVAATELTKKIETMKALKGLIIVNKLNDDKVEVFTISDQTYEHDDGQSGTVENKVLTSLKKEQKNSFENAKNSKKATTALDE